MPLINHEHSVPNTTLNHFVRRLSENNCTTRSIQTSRLGLNSFTSGSYRNLQTFANLPSRPTLPRRFRFNRSEPLHCSTIKQPSTATLRTTHVSQTAADAWALANRFPSSPFQTIRTSPTFSCDSQNSAFLLMPSALCATRLHLPSIQRYRRSPMSLTQTRFPVAVSSANIACLSWVEVKYWVYIAQIVDRVKFDARKHSIVAEGRFVIERFQTTAKNRQIIVGSNARMQTIPDVGCSNTVTSADSW